MSEFAPEQHKALPTAEQAEPLRPGEADPLAKLEAPHENVEQHAEAAPNPIKQAEAAREDIEQHAETVPNPLEQLEAAEQTVSAPTAPVNKELKAITLQRELKQLQRQLPLPKRMFSKAIHQPAIRAVSEAGARTVSRPSGLLGGGLVAFVGSASYLYLARHIGFEYNYFVFTVLFIAGFALGLVLEMLVWVVMRRQQHSEI